MSIEFGSVCSGIEAASVAWHPLGWQAAWLAEIEPYPSKVLVHHYPNTPNLGDMTQLAERIVLGELPGPDVFCGGTPCQAFSVAGLRNSLDDARGNLSLTFCEIANAIDINRAHDGKEPCVVFWENVPGVLSTKDNAFGCFLAGLAGEDDALVAPGGKWTNAGYVLGPQRAVAWRVLDAQYFGVAQRRRRVFVVASARDGFDPAAVLFEFDGVRRDTAPSREAREDVTHAVAPCLTSSRMERVGDTRGQDTVVAVAFGGNNQAGPIDLATARNACPSSSSGRLDFESETFLVQSVAFALQHAQIGRKDSAGPQGKGWQQEVAFTQDSRSCADAVAIAFNMHKSGNEASSLGISEDRTDCLRAFEKSPFAVQPAVGMQVRRLTPEECEALQGFPRGYTDIRPKGKATADGPRYKALGNSWAVPNVRWIGWRIMAELNKDLA